MRCQFAKRKKTMACSDTDPPFTPLRQHGPRALAFANTSLLQPW